MIKIKFAKWGIWVYSSEYDPSTINWEFGFLVESLGIWFPYKGDYVAWVWPWQRKLNVLRRFYGANCFSSYDTLKEMDEFWNKYWQAIEFKGMEN